MGRVGDLIQQLAANDGRRLRRPCAPLGGAGVASVFVRRCSSLPVCSSSGVFYNEKFLKCENYRLGRVGYVASPAEGSA